MLNNIFAACSWGSSWNQYSLTASDPEIIFEFKPGYAGDHKIKTIKPPGSWIILTKIYWWSDASPSWHLFVQEWGEGEHALSAGSSDVKFKISFTKDLYDPNTYIVKWCYCMAY